MMVHLHNTYPVPQLSAGQREVVVAICDAMFQGHTGEEAAAIKARLPKDSVEWQKTSGE
jgi:hypothetical protein